MDWVHLECSFPFHSVPFFLGPTIVASPKETAEKRRGSVLNTSASFLRQWPHVPSGTLSHNISNMSLSFASSAASSYRYGGAPASAPVSQNTSFGDGQGPRSSGFTQSQSFPLSFGEHQRERQDSFPASVSNASITGTWELVDTLLDCNEEVRGSLPYLIASYIVTLIYEEITSSPAVINEAKRTFFHYADSHFAILRKAHGFDPCSLLGELRGLATSSRSGSWIFSTNDKRLVLKRIRNIEKDKLRDMAPDYVQHVMDPTSKTVLNIIYGCYGCIYNGVHMSWVLLQSSYHPDTDIHRIYDLKGSTADRSIKSLKRRRSGVGATGIIRTLIANLSFGSRPGESDTCTPRDGSSGADSQTEDQPKEDLQQSFDDTLLAHKDNDLTEPLKFATREDYINLKEVLKRDSMFLFEHDIFDYSLLVP